MSPPAPTRPDDLPGQLELDLDWSPADPDPDRSPDSLPADPDRQLRIGSLFSGYGGLDSAAQAVTGGRVAWFCEIEPAPSAVLAYRWPDIPNLGDITRVGLDFTDAEWKAMQERAAGDDGYRMPSPDWSTVEPVDVLCAGFPCTDVSHAGLRAGLNPGTRSGLWIHAAYAISCLRPRLVIIENVRGLLTAPATLAADGPLGFCPWCMGDGGAGALRALGAVLGGLADLGYDARWGGLSAADVGAPHGRERIFITAWPGDTADADEPVHGA